MTALGSHGRRKTIIDVVIPTLWRADRLMALALNIHTNTRALCRILFVVERHDTDTVVEVRRLAAIDHRVKLVWNTRSANVAGAFNSGLKAVRAPYWFAGGDDLRFDAGWDEHCLAKMVDPAKVVGTRDLHNVKVEAGTTATHFLVDTDYSRTFGLTFDEQPGIVAYEGYGHDYFDTEACEVAKHRGVFAPCLDAVVEHLHYVWAKADVDRTYERNAELCKDDEQRYQDRLLAWETR